MSARGNLLDQLTDLSAFHPELGSRGLDGRRVPAPREVCRRLALQRGLETLIAEARQARRAAMGGAPS